MQNSYEIEAGILSILINFNNAIDEVCDILKPEHFADTVHRTLFTEISAQLSRGQAVDVLTLFDAVRSRKIGLDAINAISQSHAHTDRTIRRLTNALIDRYKETKLAELAHTIADLAKLDAPVSERLDRAAQALGKISESHDDDEWVEAYEAIVIHTEVIEKREEGVITGIQSGLIDFDEMLDGGFQRGNLVIVGARPAMGKTALAMTIGLSIARKYHVGFLSMEMPHQDLRDRQMAILANVPLSDLKRPKRGYSYEPLVEATEKAKTLNFRVSDKAGLNILQVRSKARALKRRRGLDVLIVDYIGLMQGLDSKQSRAYQIEEISRGLKELAKELDIVVLCLAQVNRGAAERAGQVPGLHDLRDSGAIEQDGDVIAFIHRPIASNPEAGEQFEHYGLLRIAKNRQGRTGDVHLFYDGAKTMFKAWSGEPPRAQLKQSAKDY